MSDLDTIQKKIISFRNECCWAHFRNPKNLVEAPSLAAGMQSRKLSAEEFKNA